MELIEKHKDGFKTCIKELLELKDELIENDIQYQKDIKITDFETRLNKELEGTMNFDFLCECMLEKAERTLRALSLPVSEAAAVVYAVTGVRVYP